MTPGTWTSTRGRLSKAWSTITLLPKDFTQCWLDHHYIKLSVFCSLVLKPVMWGLSPCWLTGSEAKTGFSGAEEGSNCSNGVDFSRIHDVIWCYKHVESVCEEGDKSPNGRFKTRIACRLLFYCCPIQHWRITNLIFIQWKSRKVACCLFMKWSIVHLWSIFHWLKQC